MNTVPQAERPYGDKNYSKQFCNLQHIILLSMFSYVTDEDCSNLAILNPDDPRVLITLFLLLLLWMNAVKLNLQK